MGTWNVSSSAPAGPHLALPPVFFNGSSAVELEDGKMVWDIPLDYISEPPDNWTEFNDTYSTLDTRWSTTNLQNGTTLYTLFLNFQFPSLVLILKFLILLLYVFASSTFTTYFRTDVIYNVHLDIIFSFLIVLTYF